MQRLRPPDLAKRWATRGPGLPASRSMACLWRSKSQNTGPGRSGRCPVRHGGRWCEAAAGLRSANPVRWVGGVMAFKGWSAHADRPAIPVLKRSLSVLRAAPLSERREIRTAPRPIELPGKRDTPAWRRIMACGPFDGFAELLPGIAESNRRL